MAAEKLSVSLFLEFLKLLSHFWQCQRQWECIWMGWWGGCDGVVVCFFWWNGVVVFFYFFFTGTVWLCAAIKGWRLPGRSLISTKLWKLPFNWHPQLHNCTLSTGTPQLHKPNCTTAHLTPPSQRPTQTNWQTRKLTLWELVSNQQVNWNQQRIVSNLLQFWNSLSSPPANCTLKNEPWCCPNKLNNTLKAQPGKNPIFYGSLIGQGNIWWI